MKEIRVMKKFSKIFDNSDTIFFDENSKFILMSDCHRGVGGFEDNFAKNQMLYYTALKDYYKNGYTYIELGDGDELWENRDIVNIENEYKNIFALLRDFYKEGRLYFLYGNHDIVKRKKKYVKNNMYYFFDQRRQKNVDLFKGINITEGLVLSGKGKHQNEKILLIHGHQGDLVNDYLWRIGRFLVRYFWRALERIGARDPTKVVTNYNKQKCVYNNMVKWSCKENKMIIAGHTHKPWFSSLSENCGYFNTGSAVHPRCITGIEIEKGNITLIKWHVKVKLDGSLYIGRDIIEGPGKISDYFKDV